jgi:hypothetical protein
MPGAKGNFPMITLLGHAYVFGGGDDIVYSFDTSTGVWSSRAHMPAVLTDHAAIAMNDTTALVCGGASAACYTYSSTADVWTTAASMNTGRSKHGMVVYKGNMHALSMINVQSEIEV